MNSVEVFPTVLNSSKQSGVIGNKVSRVRSSEVVWWSFGSREHSRRKSCVVGEMSGTAIAADLLTTP